MANAQTDVTEPPSTSPAPSDLENRVAAARAKRAARERASDDAAKLAEVQYEDLVDRFERELSGKLHEAFEIVDCTSFGEGFIVVKLGDTTALRTFQASKMTAMDTDAFVTPYVVHPSKEEYRRIAMRRELVPARVGATLADLFGAKASVDAGK